jgi:methylated-DNA-[protein]-cysteine S-methyltransferase
MKQYTLIGPDNTPYRSATPGTLGGHRADRIYGTLGCPGAARAIARGGYVANRVFFADEATAISAGYRPCHTCLPDAYKNWKERRAMPLDHTTVLTPIGELLLLGDDEGLAAIRFDATSIPPGSTRRDDGVLADAARQLREYTNNEREVFDVPLRPRIGGAFERRVWAHLAQIPYGTTTTYGEIAHALGAPGSARAVGAANGRNPIPIIVPCHRVIGADGSLTGYGGGLQRKQALLDHERRALAGGEPDPRWGDRQLAMI